MIVYGLLRKGDRFGSIVSDRSKLARYEKNKMFPIVKLEVTEDPNGKYFMFVGGDKIIFEDIEVLFKEKIEGLEGEIFKVNLERIA